MKWLEKLKTLNPWSLIGALSVGIAIFLSITKGFNSERVFIGILGLALLFNLFDRKRALKSHIRAVYCLCND